MNGTSSSSSSTAAPTASASAPPDLLPPDALAGLRVGISVSESADLARLGLLESHFKLALRELARTVLVGGGTLAYGGHLLPNGYTEFLVGELHQYADARVAAGRRRPAGAALLVCLAWQEHRKCSLTELQLAAEALGLYGRLHCLDLQGNLIDRRAGRSEAGEPYPQDKAVLAQGLTALRRYMTGVTSARVLLGGKRHGYTGSMPGVLEEAILALRAGQPLYLAGGPGGVALDVAAAIDPRCAGHCPRHDDDPLPDAQTVAGLDEVRALVGGGDPWARLDNGLDANENLHLALTHRPAEIAALVGLGLGRRANRVKKKGAGDGGHG